MNRPRSPRVRLLPGLLLPGLLLLACAAPRPTPAPPSPSPAPAPAPAPLRPGTIVAELRAQARLLEPHLVGPWAKDFVLATDELPPIPTRVLYFDGDRALTEAEAARLPAAARARLRRVEMDEEVYYLEVSTPLAYARPLDLLYQAGVTEIAGKRVLDFGYGGINALRLLASLGADVVGVDVNAEWHAFFSAFGDQGTVRGRRGRDGQLRVVLGRWPAEPQVAAAVGEGFDVIVAKNVLKNGYIHPERPVQKARHRFRLGVSDEEFVRALSRALRPGGRVIIYNLVPAQAPLDRPYKPWADGRCPFPAALWEAAGLQVLPPGLDRDDTDFARRMGRLLGWDRPDPRHPEDPPMDLDHDLFASYSIFAKGLGKPE